MENKFSKRFFALLLSVLMVVTAFPVTAYATTTEWTEVASSDFVNTDWGSSTVNGDWTQYNSATQSPVVNSGDKSMAWAAGFWTSAGVLSQDSNGTFIPNGYMYLKSYNGTGNTPITGSKNFKIDIAFRFDNTGTSAVKSTDDYCMIKLGTSPTLGKSTNKMWESNVLAQDAYGRLHVGGTGYNEPSSASNAIAISNSALTTGTDYHYVMRYDNGMIFTYVTDAQGKTIFAINYVRATVDTAAIANINIGDDNNSYALNGLNYRSVTFYTSNDETTTPDKHVDADKDKYLMTYFTGNSTEGETLHMAVSDDGLNFEALKGNQPIWDSSKLTGSEPSYPDNSGIAASGHVRDPYAFRAEDGSYYVLATDLNTQNGTNWGNNSKMMVWHVNSMADLADTNPWFIDTQSLTGDICVDGVDRAWAPEAIWDPEVGHYMLFWAAGYKHDGTNGNNTHMYYVYTDDFKTILTEPKLLINTGADNIDGNITYDGNLYYMWFKDEANSAIGYSVSRHASGPYSEFNKLVDVDYDSKFEGPEVYQLHSTGSYILMADHFASDRSFFATYQSNTLDGFQNNQIKNTNINHLYPRHGSVMNITTKEYNELIAKYSKNTYDASGLDGNGDSANDYLIARYFTNDDVTYDATGNGNTLTNSGVTMEGNYNGKVAAKFTGTANDNTSDNAGSSDSGNKNGTYASINTSTMFNNINIDDGLTFSWYGYAANANSGRFFDWSISDPGTIVWNGADANQNNNSYVYSASNMEFGADNYGAMAIAKGHRGTKYKGDWHLYTMTVQSGYLCFFVDGALLGTTYAKNGESISVQGSPIDLPSMTQSFFDTLKGGKLNFGISSYTTDDMFNGYMSDFRIYNRALSAQDITDSLTDLNDETPSTEVGENTPSFYDPMEDTTIDGKTYTGYGDKTVVDDIHMNVLDVTYNNKSNYDYNGTSTDASKGYTISMFYNPGDNVSSGDNGGNNDCIFYIGHPNSDDSNNKHYLQLTENGYLFFNYQIGAGNESYIDMNAFGGSTLKANTWTHIVIQVVPNGNHDIVYVYFDGTLVNKIDTFNSSVKKDLLNGQSIHEYLAAEGNNVYYGVTSGYWGNAVDGKMDDFSIYNGVYSANSVFNKDCVAIADTLLPKAINDYKTAMADISDYVYTDMANAYNAYDAVVRYRDAVSYSNGKVVSDPAEVVKLYSAVQETIGIMKQYKKPVSKYTKEGISAATAGTTTSVGKEYTNNLLTSISLATCAHESFTDGLSGGTGTKNSCNFRIGDMSFVWLYTGEAGDNPTAPMTLGAYYKGKNDKGWMAGSGTCDSSGNALTDVVVGGSNWYIYPPNGADSPIDWYYGNEQYKTNAVNDFTTEVKGYNTNRYTGTINSKYYWSYGSNYLRYDGTPSGDSITDITTVTPYFGYKCGYDNWGKKWQTLYNTNGTIKIINFVPVKQALVDSTPVEIGGKTYDGLKGILNNITDFSPESASKLLKIYDQITSYDYTLGSVSGAEKLTQDIQALLNELKNFDLKTIEPKANYDEAISTALAEQSDRQEMIDNGTSDSYTSSSWTAYSRAVDAVENHFVSLSPTTDNKPYATTQDTVDRFSGNINAAKSVLVEKADYSSVVTATAADKKSMNNSDGTQNYTYSTYTAYSDAYDTANDWATKPDDYKNDTEKYDVTYIQTTLEIQQRDNIYGPYIAYDVNDNVVTSDDQTPYRYEYFGVFYENDGDAEPSQFETGDYVKIGDSYIKLNGHRYYASSVDTAKTSVRQDAIVTSARNVDTTTNALATVADYQNYDYSQELAALADGYAYNDNGAALKENVTTYGTSDSPAAYNKDNPGKPYITVEGVTYKDADQTDIDLATADVLNDLNSNKKTYTVTFNVHVDGDVKTETSQHNYGDTVNLNAATVNTLIGNAVVSYWTVTNEDAKGNTIRTYLNNNTKSWSINIQKDTTVDVYLTKPMNDTDKLVKIVDYFNVPIDAGYVTDGTEITLSDTGKEISYTDVHGTVHTVPVNASPYYTFKCFEIDGTSAYANDKVTVSADMSIRQVGFKVVTETGSTEEGNLLCAHTVIGGTITGADDLSKVAVNTKLTLTADNTADFLVWVKSDKENAGVGDWHIASYNPTFSTFSADSGFAYVAVSQSNYDQYLTDAQYKNVCDKLPFSFGTSAKLVDGGKFRMYCDFTYNPTSTYTDATGAVHTFNINVVEVGAVYSTTANDEASLVKGAADVRAVSANAYNETTNTYTITKANAGAGNHYMRSYVSYTYTDATTGNTVPRVAYGPIVKCENGTITK